LDDLITKLTLSWPVFAVQINFQANYQHMERLDDIIKVILNLTAVCISNSKYFHLLWLVFSVYLQIVCRIYFYGSPVVNCSFIQ
jgi:hypothetical protein